MPLMLQALSQCFFIVAFRSMAGGYLGNLIENNLRACEIVRATHRSNHASLRLAALVPEVGGVIVQASVVSIIWKASLLTCIAPS
jgi:hypothetical protein